MLWSKLVQSSIKFIKPLFKTYLLWVTIFTWLIVIWFKNQALHCEVIYSNGLYPIIATFISSISNLIPLSLNDLLFTLIWIGIVFLFFVVFLKKVKLKRAIVIALKLVALNYILFYWLWGFNYFRNDVHNRFSLEPNIISDSTFNKTFTFILQNAEQAYCNYSVFNKLLVDSEIEQSYENLADELKISYPNGKRKLKPMLYNRLIVGAGISGYFGPFFNEIHLNNLLMPVQFPVILAHEKAHQFGITSEAEASFYAWIVCNNCESKQIRYSANIYLLWYFLRQVKSEDQLNLYISEISPEIKNDLKEIKKFWKEVNLPIINEVQSKMYDIYLKGNNVSGGIKNYGGVVKLVCEYYNQKIPS